MGNDNQNIKPKLLLVEPDGFIRNALRMAFEKTGYYIVAVETAKLGRQILDNDCFDVVISDFDLCDCTGIEFFDSLKDICTDKTTVLMITYGDIENHSEAIKHRVRHVIEKPFLFKKLLRIIENVSIHKLLA